MKIHSLMHWIQDCILKTNTPKAQAWCTKSKRATGARTKTTHLKRITYSFIFCSSCCKLVPPSYAGGSAIFRSIQALIKAIAPRMFQGKYNSNPDKTTATPISVREDISSFASVLPNTIANTGVINVISGSGRATMPACMATGHIDIFAFIGTSTAADAIQKVRLVSSSYSARVFTIVACRLTPSPTDWEFVSVWKPRTPLSFCPTQTSTLPSKNVS